MASELRCPCGSGEAAEACHGGEPAASIARSLRGLCARDEAGRWVLGRKLEPRAWKRREVRARVRLQALRTPAGTLLWPLGMIANGRFLRPLTVDGVAWLPEFVGVRGMLTPCASYDLRLPAPPTIAPDAPPMVVEANVMVAGDPFGSAFALEAHHDRVALFHHTTMERAREIARTETLRPSRWSFAGTDEREDPHHVYLTDLARLEAPEDFVAAGMAEAGSRVAFVTDDGVLDEREVRAERPAPEVALKVWVDWSLLADNPRVLHVPEPKEVAVRRPSLGGPFSWWELLHPAIYRVPVRPGGGLRVRPRPTANEYLLDAGPDVSTTERALALGNDRDSLARAWAERRDRPTRRRRPADDGRPDPEWQSVARQSVSHALFEILQQAMKKTKG